MSTLRDKKVLIVIAAVILLLVGGWYFMNQKKTAGTPGSQSSSGTETSGSISSLKSLISKGIAQSCTYTTDKSQGTIYMSGGKVRGDITAQVGSVSTGTHMIIMDNTNYIWTDGQSTGFKMSFDPNATPLPGSSPSTAQGSFDANTAMNYKCSAWIADSSKFTLPSGITFATFAVPSTQTAPKAPAAGSNSSQCAYCDNLTGTDRTQCLTALNCK